MKPTPTERRLENHEQRIARLEGASLPYAHDNPPTPFEHTRSAEELKEALRSHEPPQHPTQPRPRYRLRALEEVQRLRNFQGPRGVASVWHELPREAPGPRAIHLRGDAFDDYYIPIEPDAGGPEGWELPESTGWDRAADAEEADDPTSAEVIRVQNESLVELQQQLARVTEERDSFRSQAHRWESHCRDAERERNEARDQLAQERRRGEEVDKIVRDACALFSHCPPSMLVGEIRRLHEVKDAWKRDRDELTKERNEAHRLLDKLKESQGADSHTEAVALAHHHVQQLNECCERVGQLERGLKASSDALQQAVSDLDEARERARAWERRWGDDTTRLSNEKATANANREYAERDRDEARELLEEVQDVAEQYGYPGNDLIGWLSERLGAAEVRDEARERAKELDDELGVCKCEGAKLDDRVQELERDRNEAHQSSLYFAGQANEAREKVRELERTNAELWQEVERIRDIAHSVVDDEGESAEDAVRGLAQLYEQADAASSRHRREVERRVREERRETSERAARVAGQRLNLSPSEMVSIVEETVAARTTEGGR